MRIILYSYLALTNSQRGSAGKKKENPDPTMSKFQGIEFKLFPIHVTIQIIKTFQ
jgi:hypothetical protein